jgi:hypothetical protein
MSYCAKEKKWREEMAREQCITPSVSKYKMF